MTTPPPEWLRPSMLPKLALCGQYRSEPMAGAAAARGSKLDDLFRRVLGGENVSTGDLLADEKDALRWGVDTARALAGGMALEARESELKIEGWGNHGVADLLCADAGWSADLKTGQVRNYAEAQAAYAVGFMDRLFADEWTVYLLYCDQREVVTHRWTREEAEALVREALAKAYDDGPPTPNEYCGWCAARFTCPARLESVALAVKDGAPDFASATSAQLREFVLRAGAVEDFAEKARGLLKERLIGGEKVPGCSLVSKRGAKKVLWRWVEAHWKQLGTDALGKIIGDISETKLLPALEEKMPGTKIPEDQMVEMPGSSYVRVGRPKE